MLKGERPNRSVGGDVGRVAGVGGFGVYFFFFQAEDGIRDADVTGVKTCALPIYLLSGPSKLVLGGAVVLEAAQHAYQHNRPTQHQLSSTREEMEHVLTHLRDYWYQDRSEERRVGKEGRSRGAPDH